MIEAISLLPLIIVIIGVLVFRFAIRKRSLTQVGWVVAGVSLVVAFYAPLAIGVWIPDFTGKSRIVAETVDSSGQRFQVIQFWNYVDFYTTELVVSKTDGTTSRKLIDGDSSKASRARITVDEAKRTATVEANGMAYPTVELQ